MAELLRADQLGSLLRPPEVKAARSQFQEGRLSEEQFNQIADGAILDALERQKQLGIDVISDGELRRGGFQNDLADSVEGYITTNEPAVMRRWQGPGGEPLQQNNSQVVGAKLRQLRRLTGHQAAFLRQHAPGPFKMTVPSASQFPTLGFKPGLTDRFYASRSELLWDIGAIIRDELASLADEGVPYIQIDAPRYSYYVDPHWRQHLIDLGEDPEAAFEEALAVDNDAFRAARRDGVTLALHVCRGNNQSKWYAEGGYEPIAERLFNTLDVDRFLLEYDTERAGTFEPLRFVPDDKVVVLGLISTKQPELESHEELLRRIEEAAKYVPLDRLALSPQCGFASTLAGNLLTEDDQWRKLELVVETARRVWG